MINRGNQAQTISIPVAGYLPNGTVLNNDIWCGCQWTGSLTVTGGALNVNDRHEECLDFDNRHDRSTATCRACWFERDKRRDSEVSLAWNSVAGATGYNIYRSPVTGGGYVKVNAAPLSVTNFTDTGLRNAQNYFYVVTALDAAGNESSLFK